MTALTLSTAARMLHDALRDHSYEETELGPWVTRFLVWFSGEGQARPRTVSDYERPLARMCIMLAHRDLDTVTTDDLRSVIAQYPPKSKKTPTAAIRKFWEWLFIEEHIERNPAARIRPPKQAEPLVYDIFNDAEEAALITKGPAMFHRAVRVRDKACLLLLLRTGMRAGELRMLRVEDVDLAERWIVIQHGKGGRRRVVPMRGELVLALEEFMLTNLPRLSRPPERGDMVFWRYGRRPSYFGMHPDEEFTRIFLTTPAGQNQLHRWWAKCVERARILDTDHDHLALEVMAVQSAHVPDQQVLGE